MATKFSSGNLKKKKDEPTKDKDKKFKVTDSMDLIKVMLQTSRCIIHIDLDCFYCQVEQLRLDIPNTVPCAVQQWSGLLAINYLARSYGISRLDRVETAKYKCPELVLVHVPTLTLGDTQTKYHKEPNISSHKASLLPYRKASENIMKVLSKFGGTLEKASVDEAYLDVTEQINLEVSEVLESHRQNPTQGKLDLPQFDGLGVLVGKSTLDKLELSSWQQEDYFKLVQSQLTAKLALKIRTQVKQSLGYDCSAGISYNKPLAKIGSALNKPNQQTILPEASALNFLSNFPLTKIRNLGGKFGDVVLEKLGKTPLELRQYSLAELANQVGMESGKFLYAMVRGINHSPVKPNALTKSYMAAKALRPPTMDIDQVLGWVEVLATELLERLNIPSNQATEEAQDVVDGKKGFRWPKTLQFGYFQLEISQSETKEDQVTTAPNMKQKSCQMVPYHLIQRNPEKLLLKAKALVALVNPVHLFPCSQLFLSLSNFEEIGLDEEGRITNFFKPIDKPKVHGDLHLSSGPWNQLDFKGSCKDLQVTTPLDSGVEVLNPVPKWDLVEGFVSSPSFKGGVTHWQLSAPTPSNPTDKVMDTPFTCPTCCQTVPYLQLEEHKDFHLASQLQTGFDKEMEMYYMQPTRTFHKIGTSNKTNNKSSLPNRTNTTTDVKWKKNNNNNGNEKPKDNQTTLTSFFKKK